MYYKILKPFNLLTKSFKVKTLEAGEIIASEYIDSFANFENIVIANPEFFQKTDAAVYGMYLENEKINKLFDLIESEKISVDYLIQTLQSNCIMRGDIVMTNDAELNFVIMELKNGNYNVRSFDDGRYNETELELGFKKIFPKTQFEKKHTSEIAEFIRTFFHEKTYYVLLSLRKGFEIISVDDFLENYKFKKDQIIELGGFESYDNDAWEYEE